MNLLFISLRFILPAIAHIPFLCVCVLCGISVTMPKHLGGEKKINKTNVNGSTLSNKKYDKMIIKMVLKINLIITARLQQH